jgi:hypothetical protein
MKRILLVLLAACGTDGTTGGDDGAPDAAPIPDPDPDVVNFRTEIVPIFNRSCGTGDGACHARQAYGANQPMDCRGWLTLEDAALGAEFYSGTLQGQTTGCPDMPLHGRLMQLDVWQCATATAYIVPGNAGASYIMNKLNGTGLCKETASSTSDPMPPPQPENPNPFTISAADKALIQQWIEEGALDN